MSDVLPATDDEIASVVGRLAEECERAELAGRQPPHHTIMPRRLIARIESLRAQVEARGAFSDVIVAKANGYLDRLEQQRTRAAQWEDLANRVVEALRVSEERREEAEAEVEALKARLASK